MIREQIQQAVRETGLSQREVSRVTGLDETMLSRFNRGQRELTFQSIDRLLDRLGLEITIQPRRSTTKGE
jgi:transcriptional regulator with XRE-family HTH domain